MQPVDLTQYGVQFDDIFTKVDDVNQSRAAAQADASQAGKTEPSYAPA